MKKKKKFRNAQSFKTYIVNKYDKKPSEANSIIAKIKDRFDESFAKIDDELLLSTLEEVGETSIEKPKKIIEKSPKLEENIEKPEEKKIPEGGEEKLNVVEKPEDKKIPEPLKGGTKMVDDEKIAKVEKTVEELASSVGGIGEAVSKIPEMLANALTKTEEKKAKTTETIKAEEGRKKAEQERDERITRAEAKSAEVEAEAAKLREGQEALKKVIAHYEKWVPEIGAACIGKTAEECEAMAKAELEQRKADEGKPKEAAPITMSDYDQRMKGLSEKKAREGEGALTAEEKKEVEEYYWRFGEHGKGKGVALEEFLACEECFTGISKKILENEAYRKKIVEGLSDEERIKIATEACKGPACDLLKKQLKDEGFRLRVEKESLA